MQLNIQEVPGRNFSLHVLIILLTSIKIDREANFYQKSVVLTVLLRLNRGDIQHDFQANLLTIWSLVLQMNHHPKKNLLTNHVAKKVIFLRAVKTSQTIPIAQILKLVQFLKSTLLILIKS